MVWREVGTMIDMIEASVAKFGVYIVAIVMVLLLIPTVIISHAGIYSLLERAPYPDWYWIDAGLTLAAAMPVILLLLHYADRMYAQKRALHDAMNKVKEFEAISSMCAGCKKIRDDSGCWHEPDHYINKHTNSEISHGYCDECADSILRQ